MYCIQFREFESGYWGSKGWLKAKLVVQLTSNHKSFLCIHAGHKATLLNLTGENVNIVASWSISYYKISIDTHYVQMVTLLASQHDKL